jgi:hypothetical protein
MALPRATRLSLAHDIRLTIFPSRGKQETQIVIIMALNSCPTGSKRAERYTKCLFRHPTLRRSALLRDRASPLRLDLSMPLD